MDIKSLIKSNSFSVGYNFTGQDFFDTLLPYKNYIHSYFFSLTEDVHMNHIDLDETLSTLKNCERYGFKGNL